jgi:hypothetical protein
MKDPHEYSFECRVECRKPIRLFRCRQRSDASLGEGAGELSVYFDPVISVEEKMLFSRYVDEHLRTYAQDVVRRRHYVCPHCSTPVGNLDIAMKRLQEGKTDIGCLNCDDPGKRVPLWDELEQRFASPELKQRVQELQEQSQLSVGALKGAISERF